LSTSGKAYKKLTPLRYPTKKHRRTETPPSFKNHRQYKPYVQREFIGRCVYCRKSDLDQEPGAFHVEHYRPQKHFPNLATTYNNLFYACSTCNIFKADYWNQRVEARIPNPCDDVMSQHLAFRDHIIEEQSQRGLIAIEQLRLNNDNSTGYRQRLHQDVLRLIDAVIELKNKKEHRAIVDKSVAKIAELCRIPETEVRKACKM